MVNQVNTRTQRFSTVRMGEVGIARAPDKLRTVLGSCIGIALYDPARKVGGLAHIVLPKSRENTTLIGKFADTAIPHLISEIVRAGGSCGRLVAKLAGGAAMFKVTNSNNIGKMNHEAVLQILGELKVPVIGSEIGGEKGRRMELDTRSGEVLVELLGSPPVKI